MSTDIDLIRAAAERLPRLREELRALRAELLADDGVIDGEEQVYIDQIETLIEKAERAIANTTKDWQTKEAAFIQLRKALENGLDAVARSDRASLRSDQKAISDLTGRVDQAAADGDHNTALSLAQELKRLVDTFLQEEENERLNELTDEELSEISLTTDAAVEDVFTEEYMRELKDTPIKGEGDPDLKKLIKEIGKGLSATRRPEAMEELSSIVGTPPTAAELEADYARYLILCRQRDAIGDQKEQEEPDGVDEEAHPDFIGSRQQLMFGKVLGDALGIHEVFATLLSPTGGLVGPGNDLIPGVISSPHLPADNAVALHGTVHDAAGYLDTFHNEGPGYNYRGDEVEAVITAGLKAFDLDVLLPLTGQISGIDFWASEEGSDAALEDGMEFAEAIYDGAVLELEKKLEGVRADATAEIDKILFAFEEAKQEAQDAAEALIEDMEDLAEEAEEEVREFVEEVEETVLEARDALEDGVERVSRAAVETYEEVEEAARSFGNGVMDKLNSVANFIWN